MNPSDNHIENNNKPWLWKKGQSGNVMGRPKGKTMKEYAKQYLERMTDEERDEWLEGIAKDKIWEMSEGKAKQDVDGSIIVTISNILDSLENERPKAPEQGMENQPSIQDQEQTTTTGNL